MDVGRHLWWLDAPSLRSDEAREVVASQRTWHGVSAGNVPNVRSGGPAQRTLRVTQRRDRVHRALPL